MSIGHILLLIAAGGGAGVMNALAGGGTLLTYPALLLFGLDAIAANATSTVALLPGAAASLYGYRREVRPFVAWLKEETRRDEERAPRAIGLVAESARRGGS